MVGVSRFSTVAASFARGSGFRISRDIKLRKPILPTIDNLKIREDHPLWEFFHKRQFVRDNEDLEIQGRSWTVQDLRKKSFEDLHALWYVCLKELNKVQREQIIYEDIGSSKIERCMQFSDAITNSMLSIKQVLTEREAAINNARKEFEIIGDEYLQEFKAQYLEEENVETDEWFDKLERLQYAIFGINATYESVIIDKRFLDGIRYVSSLYFEKFGEQCDIKIDELRDIVEIYKLFENGATAEGFKVACEGILEYRESGLKIPGSKEIKVIQNLVDEKINEANQIDEPQQQQEQIGQTTA